MELPVEKNKEYVMTIDDLGSGGEGIGKINGFTVFVENALPEEKIMVLILKLKKNYGFGKLIRVIEPSPYRVKPKCWIAKQCGGCQLQHMSYEGQLRYKTKCVKDDIERIGKQKGIEVPPVIGMEEPWFYRNKAQFPVGESRDGKLEIGFFAKRSHRIVDTRVCYIQDKCNTEIIEAIRGFMEEFEISAYREETHKGLVRHIFTRIGRKSGEIMVCLVINGHKLPHEEILIERLRQIQGMKSIMLNVNTEKTNVILQGKTKTLWGSNTISDDIDGIAFEISPLSFYQVNPVQTEVLYKKALEFAALTGEETVLDLYCGIGTISLFFARKAKSVFGVDIIPEAIADAKENALRNGIENVRFEVGAAEELIPALYEKGELKADVIVVDPPRKGCDEALLETIALVAPKKLVYVSCNPATLARDIAYLGGKGFEVKKIQPVDQFPSTVHVETVVLMSRKDK